MESLDEGLRVRVEELTGSSKARQPLLSTTGTQATIAELVARCDRLEQALGELAVEVETLAAVQKGSGESPTPTSVS